MRDKNKVCPVEKSSFLLSKIRKLIHNPAKMFAGYLKEGYKVLEVGCGPGYFSLPLAKMVGRSGKLFALDLQEKMLEIVERRAQEAGLMGNIDKVLASATEFDLGQSVDFCLLFYVAHEIPQIELAWQNIHKHCRKGAKVYLVEPAFHVSKSEFAQTLRTAQEAGFVVEKRFGLWDRAAILSAE